MKFYKRDPDRALAGMADLTLQERGAYNTILDALYSRDGVLRADDEMLRRLLGCHGNEYRAVKSKLMGCGKIWIEGGYVKAKGVETTLEEALDVSEKQRKNARKRWEIERKNRNQIIKSTLDGMPLIERYNLSSSEYDAEDAPLAHLTGERRSAEAVPESGKREEGNGKAESIAVSAALAAKYTRTEVRH